jgi:hypothetical protein
MNRFSTDYLSEMNILKTVERWMVKGKLRGPIYAVLDTDADEQSGIVGNVVALTRSRSTADDVRDALEQRRLALRIYDTVLKESESFEFGHVGTQLAYLLGAILSGGKVDVYGGARDPNMGALYSILVMMCKKDDPVWRHIRNLKEM